MLIGERGVHGETVMDMGYVQGENKIADPFREGIKAKKKKMKKKVEKTSNEWCLNGFLLTNT